MCVLLFIEKCMLESVLNVTYALILFILYFDWAWITIIFEATLKTNKITIFLPGFKFSMHTHIRPNHTVSLTNLIESIVILLPYFDFSIVLKTINEMPKSTKCWFFESLADKIDIVMELFVAAVFLFFSSSTLCVSIYIYGYICANIWRSNVHASVSLLINIEQDIWLVVSIQNVWRFIYFILKTITRKTDTEKISNVMNI